MSTLIRARLVDRRYDPRNGGSALFYPTAAGAERVGRLSDYRPPPKSDNGALPDGTTARHRLLANRFLLVARDRLDVAANWGDAQLWARLGPTAGHEKQPDSLILAQDGSLTLVEVETSRRGGTSLAKLASWLEKILPRQFRNRPDAGVQQGEIGDRVVAAVWFVLATGREQARGEILHALAKHMRKIHPNDLFWAEQAFETACSGLFFIKTLPTAPFFSLPPDPIPADTVRRAWEATKTMKKAHVVAKGEAEKLLIEALNRADTAEQAAADMKLQLDTLQRTLAETLERATGAESNALAWRSEAMRLLAAKDELTEKLARLQGEAEPVGVPQHVLEMALQAANSAAAKAQTQVAELTKEVEFLRAKQTESVEKKGFFGKFLP